MQMYSLYSIQHCFYGLAMVIEFILIYLTSGYVS